MEQIKVFVDTNIVLDYFYDRMRDGCAKTIVLVGQESKYEMCISILTAINVLYITKKYETSVNPDDIARLFRILPQDYEQYSYAQTIDIDDFEDAMQLACAVGGGCRAFVTRDRDLLDSDIRSIQIFSPEEFIERIKL
ncbi:MAG: PIN domain-containing protein [Candidatus Cryptobacteroides sp.]|nr:PIN domain-containing protein [Candidatus Cryptobacteroides sp.]